MTLCGQTKLHVPHWMQVSGSQTATRSEIRLFSYAVVPVGKVPSTGSALTGRSSPRPAIMTAVTVRTKSGAWSGTTGGSGRVEVAPSGTGMRCNAPTAASTAASLRATISAPRRPYEERRAALTRARASSRGSTPEMAKKQVCSTVLDRPGERRPHLARRVGSVEQQGGAVARAAQDVQLVQEPDLVAAHETRAP